MGKIAIGTGMAHGLDLAWLGAEGTPPPPPFAALVNLGEGTADIIPGPTSVSVTITGTTDFDGTYVSAIADLQAGPVNLVPPALNGTGVTGTDLTLRAGLWMFEDTGSLPSFSSEWQRDGAPVSGQNGATYTVQESDEGSALSVREQASGGNGTRDVTSTSVIAAPPIELTLDEGTAEITAGPGVLDITITGTPEFDGTYSVNTADLDAGPVNLVAPALIGLAEAGETLSLREGLWVYEDTGADPVISHAWYRDTAPIPGETGPDYTIQTLDEGTSLSVQETATGANGSRMAQTAPLAVDPPAPTLELSRVGGFQSSGTPTDTPTFTLDLSAYDSGDQIIVFYGPSVYAASVTVDGAAGTKITTDGANSGASRMAAFAHTLSGPGSASAQLEVGLPSAINHHVISVHAVRGGVISDVMSVRNTDGAPQTLSVAPTTANNAILACAMGVSFMDEVFTWTGATELETANVPTASSRNVSAAQQSNVAIGPHSVTGTPSGTSHTGIIALAISEM